MRREEICALKVGQVRTDVATGIRYLTRSGTRPKAPSATCLSRLNIATLIDELAANATADDYLIHDGTIDQFGLRGGGVGGRFSDEGRNGLWPAVPVSGHTKNTIRCMKVQRKVVAWSSIEHP